MAYGPSVAIVILNYNNHEYLKKYLPLLLNVSYSNFTIYIIDNASTDLSIEYIIEKFPQIKIIRNDTNKGYALGYNDGLKNIEADYFAILNSDVEVDSDFLKPIIELMEKQASIAVCQPKVLSISNRNMFEYAGGSGGFIDELGYTFTRGRIFDHLEKDENQYNDAIPIFWASGACFIIRSSIFKQLNGFYPYYFMYSEEVDLCWRVQSAGYKIYVCPNSIVFHRETNKLISQKPKRIFMIFRNNLIMLHRNSPIKNIPGLLFKRWLLNIGAILVFLAKGNLVNSFQILLANFSYLKWALFNKDFNGHPRVKLKNIETVYKGSVVMAYFLKRIKTFKELTKTKF